ncbi:MULTISPECIES: efflux transporter outer membrane subunit [unclassified Pseudomonas]|uniref:efflux transporter outer membrane subunit n=1 Tax=unclassified Pseudomonas TaxID=196821 RepID=UPI0035C218EB
MTRLRFRRTHSVLVLAALAGMGGCMVGPDYQRPEVQHSERFVGSRALEARHSLPSNAPFERWWQGFGDPVLDRLVDTALRQNLSLEQALARRTQAQAFAQGARAQLLPEGHADAGASRARRSLQDPQVATERSVLPGFERSGTLYDAGISSLWELDLAGGLRRGAEAALAEYQAAQADQAAARIQVAAGVIDGYLLVRLLQARLGVAEEQVATQGAILRLVEVLKNRGLAPDRELQQSRAELALAQASVPALRTRLSAARNNLDVLLARLPGTPDAGLDAPAPLPTAPRIEAAGGTAALLRGRPDLIVAERRLAAANERIGQALAEYYPKVSLSALIGSTTPHAGDLFSGDSKQAAATLGLRWRLFDFGRVDAEVQGAKGAYAGLLASYREQVLEASAEVENSISALLEGERRAHLLGNSERARAQARDAVLAGYRQGNASHIELLETQARLQQAQADRLDAAYDAAASAVTLYKALGGGWNGSIEADTTTSGSHHRSIALN